MPVVTGAQMMCAMGTSPSVFNASPKPVLVESLPAGTIMDNVPFLNVPPFGLCTSLMNPITAAQTTAAAGVLTPGTCTPMLPAPWVPGSPTVMLGGIPALNNTCMCMCAYGGVIQITNPGTTREVIP